MIKAVTFCFLFPAKATAFCCLAFIPAGRQTGLFLRFRLTTLVISNKKREEYVILLAILRYRSAKTRIKIFVPFL